MKRLLAGALVLMAGLLIAETARADADSELFDTNQQNLDASLEMRRTTTEQFDPVRGQSVLDRPRPDYDPIPIALGSFQLFPAINVGTYYDTNIFATSSDNKDDQVWKVNPTVSLLSDWGRNAVALTALGDLDYYEYHNEQDYQSGAVQAEGRYDIAEQTWLAGATGYQRVTEAKGGPSTPGNLLDASQYNLYTASGEAYRGVGELKAKVDYDFGYYDYSPVTVIGTGLTSQSDRDRAENKVGSEIGYDLTENFKPFIRGSYNFRNYKDSGARNSDGYTIDVGSKMDWGGVTTAEAWLGYMTQDYYNYVGGSEVTAPDFGADIVWNVTELTSIEAKAQRSIEETTEGAASSYLASEGSVTLAHELRRDLVLQMSVLYDAIDYQDFPRHDDLYNIGAGGRYYINHNLYTDLTYGYERNTSDVLGNDYEAHTIFLRLGAQY